jgi:hypothetical protein
VSRLDKRLIAAVKDVREMVSRAKECPPSKVRRYKGMRMPTCNGGLGCFSCWAKWEEARKSH